MLCLRAPGLSECRDPAGCTLLRKVLWAELPLGAWLWCLHPAVLESELSLACWIQLARANFLTLGTLASSC